MLSNLDPIIQYLSTHHHGFDDFLPLIPDMALWGFTPIAQVITILVLTLIIGAGCIYDYLNENKFVFYLVVFLEFILFLFMLVYSAQVDMRHDQSWFISPRRVGWLWSIVNFVIYGGVIYVHMTILQYTLAVFSAYNDNDHDLWPLMLGFWIIGMIIFSILTAIDEVIGAWAILIYFAIIICITIFQIFSNIISSGNIFKGLSIGVLYFVGSFAVMINVVEFMALVIFISFFAILGIGALSAQTVSGNNFIARDSSGSSISLRRTGIDSARDSFGDLFHRNSDDSWSKH